MAPTARAFSSLRLRLLLLVFLAILPAFALIVMTAFEQRRLGADAAKDEAVQLVRLGALEQTRVFDGARQLLTSLARSADVLKQNGPACSRRLSEILGRFPPRHRMEASSVAGCRSPLR